MKSKLHVFLSGLIVGAATGAVIAYLLSKDGKNVKQQLNDAAQTMKNDLADRIESLKNTIEAKKQNLK